MSADPNAITPTCAQDHVTKDLTVPHAELQVRRLLKRFALAPATAALIASLVFGAEARA
jgi:hypothetical protein